MGQCSTDLQWVTKLELGCQEHGPGAQCIGPSSCHTAELALILNFPLEWPEPEAPSLPECHEIIVLLRKWLEDGFMSPTIGLPTGLKAGKFSVSSFSHHFLLHREEKWTPS